jgi:FemAB-related protein (PEP-CTERM system-associated)
VQVQRCESLTPALAESVRAYLATAPADSGVCGEHDPGWLDALRDGLGHQPRVFIAREGSDSGAIVGYLPTAYVSSLLFGRYLVSLPYLNRAGVVARDGQVAAALIDAAVEQAQRDDAAYLELRHGAPITHASLGGQRDDKVRMTLPLPADAEALWKEIHSKVRNQIRKGDKSDLSVRFGGLDLLDAYYDVFAVNMRDLGTPVYGRGLFAAILRHLPQRAELVVVNCKEQPVAGALLIHDPPTGGADKGLTSVPSASSLREFNATNCNMWMYHHLLLRAIERGSGTFDFGRSSVDSGTYKFKKQWGAEPQPTVWQYHVRRGEVSAVRPDNPKYRRRIETWQKLPIWLTRLVGPSIVRGIP